MRALNYASAHGMHTIALTGATGGKMAAAAEIVIRIPKQEHATHPGSPHRRGPYPVRDY